MNVIGRNAERNIANELVVRFNGRKFTCFLPQRRSTMKGWGVIEDLRRRLLGGVESKGHGGRGVGRVRCPWCVETDEGQKGYAGLTVTRLCAMSSMEMAEQ